MFKKHNKIKNIKFICICSIILILLLIIIYLCLNTEIIIKNDFDNISKISNNESNTYSSDLMVALGPCLRIEITANNMNLLGIIVTGNAGQNIFNNGKNIDIVNIGKYISTPLPTTQPTQTTSTNPEPSIVSNTELSDLFMQTIGINYLSCDFNENIKDSNNNIILRCIDSVWSQIESNMKTTIYDQILDSTKMFKTPDNTQTTLFINIPQEPSKPVITMPIDSPPTADIISTNNYIGYIVLCLNSNIDNTIMLNSLKMNVFGLNNESIAMWQINDVVDPSTNFLKFILYKPYKPHTPSKSNTSNFININSNEKFLDIPPVSINTSMLTTTNLTSEDENPTTNPITTNPITTNPITTKPITTNPNTIEFTDYGYKIFSNPHTNLFQQDFNGTSNIYSPYIYYD